MNSWKLQKQDLFYLFGSAASLLFSTVIYLNDRTSPTIWFACIFSIFLLIFRHLKSPPILILGSYFFYIALSPNYLYIKNIPLTAWSEFQSAHYFGSVIFYLNCFISTLNISLSGLRRDNLCDIKIQQNRPNKAAFLIALALSAIALTFGTTGDTILDAAYYQGETERSALHEYFIVPFFALLIFKNQQSKNQNTLIRVLLTIFIVKSFLYGGRIEVLQITLLYAYFEYNYLKYTSFWKLSIFACMAFVAFTILGMARSDFFGVLQIIQTPSGVASLFGNEVAPAYISNTSSEVIYSSARLHGLVETNVLTMNERILSFLSSSFNILAPSAYWPDYANLSSYKRDIHPSNGGGLISSYFFTWLDSPGPLIAGAAIGLIIRRAFENQGRYTAFYATLVLISFPRWFSYNPTAIVKFCIIGIALIALLDQLIKIRLSQIKSTQPHT